MKITEAEPTRDIKAALISPPKTGKTWLLGTFVEAGGLAIADCDNGGYKTIISPAWKKAHPDLVSFLDQIEVKSFEDKIDRHTGMFKKATAFWTMVDWLNEMLDRDDIATVALDTLTSAAVLAMHVGLEINAQGGDSAKSKTLKKLQAPENKHKIIVPTQADYGTEMAAIQQLIDQLTAQSKNVIICCHERVDRDKEGNITRIEPLVTGARLRAMFGQWFDEVWYLEARGSGASARRELRTQPTSTLKGIGTRLGVPDGLEDPTYAKIIAAVKGDIKVESRQERSRRLAAASASNTTK